MTAAMREDPRRIERLNRQKLNASPAR